MNIVNASSVNQLFAMIALILLSSNNRRVNYTKQLINIYPITDRCSRLISEHKSLLSLEKIARILLKVFLCQLKVKCKSYPFFLQIIYQIKICRKIEFLP